MKPSLKIATWNLCLGLASKKNLVKHYIIENEIDICCLQETELQNDLPNNLLSFPGYGLELEQNDDKRRVGAYVKSSVKYKRRHDLEGINSHLVVLDVLGSPELRVISIYRTFKPQDNITAREKFEQQLKLIRHAATKNFIVIGDFNIDYAKKFDVTYANKQLFADFETHLAHLGLYQHVNFPTWSRTVNGTLKESILDHIYSNCPTLVNDVRSLAPIFGDHLLIFFNYSIAHDDMGTVWRRDWRFYSASSLCSELSVVNWDIDACNVQEYWNIFENALIKVVDKVAPYTKFKNNVVLNSSTPHKIKTMLNARKNLLKKLKTRPSDNLKQKIKDLDINVKKHFFQEKRKKVRRGILPGNSKSLWNAVRTAKDQNIEGFPKTIFSNGVKIPEGEIPDTVASFFDNKVKRLVQDSMIDPLIYNGRLKIQSEDCFFMGRSEILECVGTLKVKNSEGYDRLPQRILKDGISHLADPLCALFKSIYDSKVIPDQWKIAKVNPIPKKGPKSEISNYRPISNLCSTSKIFEKLILRRLISLQELNGIDLTGKQQHGFKKKQKHDQCRSSITVYYNQAC